MGKADMGADDFDAIAELLRALGHPVRLQILRAVREAELSVGDIEEATGIGQPGLSQQLAVLRKAELVTSQRNGKQVFYRVDAARMGDLSRLMADMAGGAPTAHVPAPQAAPASPAKGGAAGFARVLR